MNEDYGLSGQRLALAVSPVPGNSKFSSRFLTSNAAVAKNLKYQFAVQVERYWYWYENWVDEVRKYCQQEAAKAEKRAAAAEAQKTAPALKK